MGSSINFQHGTVVTPEWLNEVNTLKESNVPELHQQFNEHIADTSNVHGAVSTASANKLVVRDAAGRAKVAAPIEEDDVAIKSNVTTVQTNLASHLADNTPHAGATNLHHTQATNRTINVPADYTTIQAAHDSLLNTYIPPGVLVTIQVAAGIYTQTSGISITHPNADRIQIIGADPISTTIVSLGSVSGSAGNYSVTINVNTAANMFVGQFVIISASTGTGDHEIHRGCWKITAINSNAVTITNTCQKASFPGTTLTGGTFAVYPTILQCNGSNGLVLGLSASGNVSYPAKLYFMDKVIISGDGVGTHYGLYVLGHSDLQIGTIGITGFTGISSRGIILVQGARVHTSGFFSVCNCYHGVYIETNSYLGACNYSIVNGNANDGVSLYSGGNFYCYGMTSSGNGGIGLVAQVGSSAQAQFGVMLDNGLQGLYALSTSTIFCSGVVSKNNGSYGLYAGIGSSAMAGNSTCSGNGGADYCATGQSYIYCASCVGTPVFSPAIETVGNRNALISGSA